MIIQVRKAGWLYRLAYLGAIIALAIPLLPIGSVPAAIAATPTAQQRKRVSVTDDGPAKFWSGAVYRNQPSHAGIAECEMVYCDTVQLDVDLPKRMWTRAGGVEVSIRWTTDAFDDSVGLYIYKDGKRVAKSDAFVSTAQSAQIRFGKAVTKADEMHAEWQNGVRWKNPNGRYKVYVAYNSPPESELTSPKINYEGLSEVEYDPIAKSGQKNFLPDLVLKPTPTITFDTPNFGVFETPPPPGESCFQSEKIEDGAQRCLRFDIESTNAGDGNLELRFSMPADMVPTDGQQVPVLQRVYNTDGTFTDRPTGASVVWHDIHGHWHFADYALAELVKVDANNNPIPGLPKIPGSKPSFCIADTRLDAWGVKGNGPMSYPAPDCLSPESVSNGVASFKQGLTRGGFGDTYNWFLNGQYINIPPSATDGRYILYTRVDPQNRLLERKKGIVNDNGAGERNNCTSVVVQLSNLATSTPKATRLGNGPACS